MTNGPKTVNGPKITPRLKDGEIAEKIADVVDKFMRKGVRGPAFVRRLDLPDEFSVVGERGKLTITRAELAEALTNVLNRKITDELGER